MPWTAKVIVVNKRIQIIVKKEILKYVSARGEATFNFKNSLAIDLKIYGDDFEELIEDLSKEINFSFDDFFSLFVEEGFSNLSEFYFPYHKFFYLDLKALLKGKIFFKPPLHTNKKLMNVEQLINLIEKVTKMEHSIIIETTKEVS